MQSFMTVDCHVRGFGEEFTFSRFQQLCVEHLPSANAKTGKKQ